MALETKTVKAAKVKVVRKETVELSEHEQFIVAGLAASKQVAMQQLELAQRAIEEANSRITEYMGIVAIERFEFTEGADIGFESFSLEEGKVTIIEYEAKDVPKDAAGKNGANAKPNAKARPETGPESGSKTEETPAG